APIPTNTHTPRAHRQIEAQQPSVVDRSRPHLTSSGVVHGSSPAPLRSTTLVAPGFAARPRRRRLLVDELAGLLARQIPLADPRHPRRQRDQRTSGKRRERAAIGKDPHRPATVSSAQARPRRPRAASMPARPRTRVPSGVSRPTVRAPLRGGVYLMRRRNDSTVLRKSFLAGEAVSGSMWLVVAERLTSTERAAGISES